MNITKTLYVSRRVDWRRWLSKHYKTEKEIWLVYYRKDSGEPRLAYNDAVEEALCFGWIDSNIKSLDKERFAQRFSPRKPSAAYSPANEVRLLRLIARGKVHKSVLATLGSLGSQRFKVAPDILRAIKANAQAWSNYRRFSPTYRRIRVGFIEGARQRPQEFQKRLRYFIRMTERGKQFGFGGIDNYF